MSAHVLVGLAIYLAIALFLAACLAFQWRPERGR
jgi:hypothetical protein